MFAENIIENIDIYDNGHDPEPESDFSNTIKDFDIAFEEYGDIYELSIEEEEESYLETISPY